MSEIDNEITTTNEIAKLFKANRRTVSRIVSKGVKEQKIRCYKLGGKTFRYSKSDVVRYLKENGDSC